MSQAPRDAHGHAGSDTESCGDRGALEVFGLAGCVFGEGGDGDVEAGKAGQAAEDEEGEEEGVDGGAEAEGEGADGGGDAEGDLVEVWGLVGDGFAGKMVIWKGLKREKKRGCCLRE